MWQIKGGQRNISVPEPHNENLHFHWTAPVLKPGHQDYIVQGVEEGDVVSVVGTTSGKVMNDPILANGCTL